LWTRFWLRPETPCRGTRFQQLQADRKRTSKEIGAKKAKGEDTSEIEAQVRAVGEEIARLEDEAKQLEAAQRTLLLNVPNLPHEHCPVGASSEDNPLVRTWGEKPTFTFTRRAMSTWKDLGLLDSSGRRKSAAVVLLSTQEQARLERALINFLLDLHTREHGYTEVSPPFLVNSDALVGTTQLPKFEEQQYRCERDDMYLVPRRRSL